MFQCPVPVHGQLSPRSTVQVDRNASTRAFVCFLRRCTAASVILSASLKAELKAWEAAFRASHAGQDPTKQDIKRDPLIAAKYKEYNASKKVPAAHASASRPSSSKPTPSTDASLSDVFKTPTKPKPARVAHHNTTSATGAVSPSNSANASAGEPKTTYVIANSPSKLRTLAALHSRSPNKNKRQKMDLDGNDELSSETNGRSQEVRIVGSPKKYNPFATSASPSKHDSSRRSPTALFGAEAARPATTSSSSSSRQTGLTSRAEDVPAWKSMFAPGPGGRSTSAFTSLSSQAVPATSLDMDLDPSPALIDAEDAALGPSPIKPRPSKDGKRRKSFTPLFSTVREPVSVIPAAPPPKLFEADISTLRAQSQSLSNGSAGSSKDRSASAEHPAVRGTKRTPFEADLPPPDNKSKGKLKANGQGKGKAKSKTSWSESDEDDAAEVGTNRKRAAKGAQATKVNGKAKGKDKGKGREAAEDSMAIDHDGDDDHDHATLPTLIRPRTLLLARAPEDDEAESEMEEGDARLDKVVIHPRRPFWETRGQTRARDKIRAGNEDEDDGESFDSSLFYRDSADLLSSVPMAHTRLRRSSPLADDDSASPHHHDHRRRSPSASTAQLPADLSAILSLSSTSPVKRTLKRQEAEKASRVQRLLGGPGLAAGPGHGRGKRLKGLLDLEEDEALAHDAGLAGRAAVGEEEGESEEDDDWASDAEGWKDLGDGEMDGYEREMDADGERW